MKLVNALALLFTTASSLMLTAYADDELATPALRRAAVGSTHSSAASSSISSSSFLEQAEDIKAKLVVKKKKAKKIEGEDEGTADPYANSNFEGKCKGVTEEDSVNWMFCEVLCTMCEIEGECCISKHLGCRSNPSLSHLYEGFLENPHLEECHPECQYGRDDDPPPGLGELATPALRAATAGSTDSAGAGASSSISSSSFLEQAEDVKAKLVFKKKKAKKLEGEGEGTADPYANSRFELICVDVTEEDSVNWMFCEPLCKMCVNGGECCIAQHLGCPSNPSLSDQVPQPGAAPTQFLAKPTAAAAAGAGDVGGFLALGGPPGHCDYPCKP